MLLSKTELFSRDHTPKGQQIEQTDNLLAQQKSYFRGFKRYISRINVEEIEEK